MDSDIEEYKKSFDKGRAEKQFVLGAFAGCLDILSYQKTAL